MIIVLPYRCCDFSEKTEGNFFAIKYEKMVRFLRRVCLTTNIQNPEVFKFVWRLEHLLTADIQ